jgi:hypothetical protein
VEQHLIPFKGTFSRCTCTCSCVHCSSR